ncbi:MAG: glycosyltransferase family 2 protein [Candidatus Hodarchaeota archaeon]
MKNLLVSIIIAIYSERRLPFLIKLLKQIEKQTYDKLETIIIVDNNHELFLKIKKIQFQCTTVLHNVEEKGLSISRNLGIKASKGEIIAFIDDDAIPTRFWVEKLVKSYSKKTLAVGGLILPLWARYKPYWFPPELLWAIGCTYKGMVSSSTDTFVRNLIGCNMSFRRHLFNDLGLFRRGLGRIGNFLLGGEEMEYCLRISLNYGKNLILLNPFAVVHHFVEPERTKITFLIKRCLFEGISKSLIEKELIEEIKNGNSLEWNPLEGENRFLRSLLLRSIPTYLLRPKRISDFFQGIVILLSILTVGIGYAYGRFIFSRSFNAIEISRKELNAY